MRVTHHRRGFTLPELLLVVVLLLVVLGTVAAMVQRQQRFYAAVTRIIDQRTQLRDALDLLPADLRGASSAGGDFLVLSDSAVELRAAIGTGIVCDTAPGRTAFFLPPPTLALGNRLTILSTLPRDGDELFAYDDALLPGNVDDRWQRLTVLQVDSTLGVCPGPPFTDPILDAAAQRLRVVVHPGDTLRHTVRIGAPVRFTRRIRYSLYRSQSEWHLGFRDWNRTVFNGIQPLSGPYMPYSSSFTTSGLAFRFTDSLGAQITSGAGPPVARVDIAARARTAGLLRAEGFRRGRYADSLSLSIAVRNRR